MAVRGVVGGRRVLRAQQEVCTGVVRNSAN